MTAFGLALRVLRVDRRTRTSTILTAVGVAVATGLVLLLVGLPFATQARAERASWQQPNHAVAPDAAGAPLLLASSGDYTGTDKITRVDVAVTGDPAALRLPPGVPRLPGPGEVLLSPALFEKVRTSPAAQLGDRFGPNIVGTIGSDGLRYPEQLVALVGHAPGEMTATAVPMTGFDLGDGQVDPLLQLLAGVGVVVLLVPSLVLVASAARLTAARRERRLAALRLSGATPGQVTAMVAAETTIAAAGGALLGLAVSPLLFRLAALVPWDGGTWQPGDFVLPIGLSAVIVVAMPLLVLLAAVLGLRRVVTSPLSATGGHSRKPLHWWRLLVLPAAGLFFFYVITTADEGGGLLLVFLALAFVVGSAAVVGPWITSAIGGLFVRGWRRPAVLLAGRRLRDDPRGAYRSSAGVVLAVFAGSMALTLLPSFEAMAGGGRSFEDSVLYVETDAEGAERVLAGANAELARYGQVERAVAVGMVYLVDAAGSTRSALVAGCAVADELTRFDMAGACAGGPAIYSDQRVNTSGLGIETGPGSPTTPLPAGVPFRPVVATDGDVSGSIVVDPAVLPAGVVPERVTVAVPTTPENREVVRTALVGAAGGAQVESRELRLEGQQTQLADLRRVTVIGLVAAAVLAGCSAAIATAGSVMDRRRTFGALIAAGTPVRVLARALRAEAAMPALVATVGAGAAGVFVAVGLLSLIDRDGVVLSPWSLAPVVLGIGVAALAASVCRPALRRVQAEPLADE
ncbi:FtsX-like permease family protein [Amycolatopsis arida]|uniref:FtsX-like permease family protein n=1 Tax=Amycolatopsis arida TaxID=587909 RepID=A0A1I5TKV0_9PSEU|nr:FtsX-like permease family protein [Amycolatopsis arida]TDX96058.1 FtsX-like permease family protein [Amycolatopsis arida]SFP83665.1 FtsX-like permease family protein [Amycolatopsis arida]